MRMWSQMYLFKLFCYILLDLLQLHLKLLIKLDLANPILCLDAKDLAAADQLRADLGWNQKIKAVFG